MDLSNAIKTRHSVRAYTDRPIEGEVKDQLISCIEQCNEDSGIRFQLVTDEPEAFSGFMARYGKFFNVRNYIAVTGKNSADSQQACGYYGEKIVLTAQALGLNTCWVAMTYSKNKTKVHLEKGEKILFVIAVGYGTTEGVPHKSKQRDDVIFADGPLPQWFIDGIDATLLAPTAMNQQKFKFYLNGNEVSVKPGIGFYSKTDLGIVKRHFEIGAGIDNFQWV